MYNPELFIFDPATHTYYYDGKVIPGVSGIIEAGGLSDFSMIPSATLAAAQEFGTNVHKTCEAYDKGILDEPRLAENPLTVPLIPRLEGYKKFLRDCQPEVVANECSVCSLAWWFAGTLDRIFRINNKLMLFDLKSPSSIRPAAKIQTAFYRIAWNERHPDMVVNQRAVLQVLDYDYRIHWYSVADNAKHDQVAKSLIVSYGFKRDEGLLKKSA
jgi:hypothetical protein